MYQRWAVLYESVDLRAPSASFAGPTEEAATNIHLPLARLAIARTINATNATDQQLEDADAQNDPCDKCNPIDGLGAEVLLAGESNLGSLPK